MIGWGSCDWIGRISGDWMGEFWRLDGGSGDWIGGISVDLIGFCGLAVFRLDDVAASMFDELAVLGFDELDPGGNGAPLPFAN